MAKKTKKKPPFKKWLLIASVSLVLLIFAYPFYQQLKIQKETAGWKTHENTKYGYSIKYPADTVEFKYDRFFLIGDSGRKDTADGLGPELQVLWRGYRPAEEAARADLGESRKLKSTKINGYPAIEIAPHADFSYHKKEFHYFVSTISSDRTIRLDFNSKGYAETVSNDSIIKMKVIATKMLSTFKFTEIEDNITVISENKRLLYLSIDGAEQLSNLPTYSEVAIKSTNDTHFKLAAGYAGHGGCANEDFGKTCGYYDEEFNSNNPNLQIKKLRVWKKNDQVFMLNPQGIYFNGKYLTDRILVTKTYPNEIFTDEEVSFWKTALQSITSD